MGNSESKISNTEWGLVIGALLVVDIVNILIEWASSWWGPGLVIIPLIDLFTGMSFALYLQLRGQSLANPKRLMGLLVTFVGEVVPVVDELPFWCLDGVYNFFLAKGEATFENNLVIGKIATTGSKIVGKYGKTTQTVEGGIPTTRSEAFTPIAPRKEFEQQNNATNENPSNET